MADLDYMSEELTADVNRALVEAVDKVRGGQVTKAAVSLGFEIGLDQKSNPIILYTLKRGTTRKEEIPVEGKIPVARLGQTRIDYLRETGER